MNGNSLSGQPIRGSNLVRVMATVAALGAAIVTAGCDTDSISSSNAKANRPVSPKLLSEMEKKNMDSQSPMLVRIFKQEAELEVWKQDRSGRFELLQTYPICRWSGDLGPKIKEGDRQAPEGFYSITPAQMNPQSQYFLSFNTGYPNAFDKALGRTGSELMVHGDCSSRGCYAMTDEQISEIYALGRESFFGGQRAFQLQAYPFRMTAQNLAKHRNNPNMPFWKMIKQGNDHFEVTRQEPKVDFCEKRYVFDAQAPAGSTRALAFNASAKCPDYELSSEVADAVRAKQAKDDARVAELAGRTPVARMNTGIDGGMNRVFASKLPNGQTGLSDNEASGFSTASYAAIPGTIPAHVNPPKAADQPAEQQTGFTGFTGFSFLKPAEPAAATTAARPAATPAQAPAKPASPAVRAAEPKPATAPAAATRIADAKSDSKAVDNKTAAAPAKPSPQATTSQTASTPAAAPPGIVGGQPIVQSNSFDNRWSSFR